MRWETLGRAPEGIWDGATAVDGNTVHVTQRYTHHVWAYDLKEDKWTRLPDCPQCNTGLTMVNGLLTAVGGSTSDCDATNTLVSLAESRSEWTEHFPPMPVKLYLPAVVCTGNHLLVMSVMEKIIHVMDTTSLKWFSAGSFPLHYRFGSTCSLSVCGSELYVLDSMRSVFSCSLPTLLQSSSAVQPETTDVWQRVADVPVWYSTLTTLCGQLVAVGGHHGIRRPCSDDPPLPLNTMYQYNPSTNSWQIIGHMPTARYDCLVATLPGDALVVIGGITREGDNDFVEVAYPV